MSVLGEVNRTLEALDLGDVEAGAVELARVYAGQLDQAAIIRAQADKAVRAAERTDDEALIEQVSALRARLGERECVNQIGARLHAILAELHATPKSRAGVKQAPSKQGTLHRLRTAT